MNGNLQYEVANAKYLGVFIAGAKCFALRIFPGALNHFFRGILIMAKQTKVVTRYRDADKGHFLSKPEALKRDPKTVVKEKVPKPGCGVK